MQTSSSSRKCWRLPCFKPSQGSPHFPLWDRHSQICVESKFELKLKELFLSVKAVIKWHFHGLRKRFQLVSSYTAFTLIVFHCPGFNTWSGYVSPCTLSPAFTMSENLLNLRARKEFSSGWIWWDAPLTMYTEGGQVQMWPGWNPSAGLTASTVWSPSSQGHHPAPGNLSPDRAGWTSQPSLGWRQW